MSLGQFLVRNYKVFIFWAMIFLLCGVFGGLKAFVAAFVLFALVQLLPG